VTVLSSLSRNAQFGRTALAYGRWWLGELRALCPAAVQRAAGWAPAEVLLTMAGERAVAPDGGPAPGADAIDPARQRAIAVIAASDVLRRRLALPGEAASDIHAVVGFELERLTPFRADDLAFDCRVVGRNPIDQRIDVDAFAVPRTVVERTIGALQAAGYRPERAVAIEAGSVVAQFPAASLIAPPRERGRTFRRLAGLLVVALLAATYGPLWRIDRTSAALEHDIAALRSAIADAQSSQTVAERNARRLASAVAVKHEGASVLQVVSDLSQHLPDGIWLTQLSINGNEASVEGRTPSASGLVRLLERLPGFGPVGYLAPVTRDPSGEGERFHFSLALTRGRP